MEGGEVKERKGRKGEREGREGKVRGHWILKLELLGSCEMPDMNSGNSTLVICRKPKQLSHRSSQPCVRSLSCPLKTWLEKRSWVGCVNCETGWLCCFFFYRHVFISDQ